ncbi:uncharacterized protein LOC142304102 [Anomaloglossus baeobatrachus]|uniref:uncharacterized protein LOC142304102 n=1 Tax=Anomaloglossus baeobatrachus TaxID=238106 RepID=UPI003F4FA15A
MADRELLAVLAARLQSGDPHFREHLLNIIGGEEQETVQQGSAVITTPPPPSAEFYSRAAPGTGSPVQGAGERRYRRRDRSRSRSRATARDRTPASNCRRCSSHRSRSSRGSSRSRRSRSSRWRSPSSSSASSAGSVRKGRHRSSMSASGPFREASQASAVPLSLHGPTPVPASRDGVPQFDAGSMQCGQTLPPVGVGLGNEGMMSLVRASVAESTWNSYGKAWREWCVMAGENPEVLPPARLRELVVGFLLHLREKGVPYSSAVKKVSGISFHLRLRGMTDVTKIFLVQQALKGWRKQHVRRENRRPVSYELMGQLIGALGSVCTDPFEVSLFSAAFCLAFFGALRIGELVSVSKLRPGGLLHNDVVLSNGTVQMRIRRSKTDQGGLGSWVVLQPVRGHTCPLRIITEYLACRTEGQVFLSHIDGSPLTRFQFISVLRKCLAVVGVPPGDFGTHSFRIGAATEASRAGLSIGKVKQIGRWKSDCVNSYVRPELLI